MSKKICIKSNEINLRKTPIR